MQDPLRGVRVRWRERFRMHPTNATLIAYRDGELAPDVHARIEAHLQQCEQCKAAALRVEEDLLHFEQLTRGVEVGPLYEAGWVNLQTAMADQSVEVPPSSALQISPEILDSIRMELTIYLGAQAAERILARARISAPMLQDLVKVIEPLMVGLLGNRGGSAVAGRLALLGGSVAPPACAVTQ